MIIISWYNSGIMEEQVYMKIEHIAMYVNDLEKARKFFVQYLGAVSNEGYYNINWE